MKLIFTFLLTGLSLCAFCQDTIRTYFDAFWRPTVEQDASYYRKLYKNAQNLWVANDFYLDGQLQMQGYFSNPKTEKKTGHFTYYYANGAKESEGEYADGYKTGPWRSWFYSNALDSEGNYARDKKIGTWVWYHKNGQISAREIYENDKLKEFEYFDEAGVKSL
ncbi:toxin-antitoxin system YwqK family antitoxin [Haliscomenobacter sp.]|uniref:toxin-antitoxin system YwqK family antitoxin n=1 Tax=Haliscomenobacter sp. TaxID=2717303 RepID=UPI0035939526